ncbi:MAG: GNAT family N-acetyltransferase, partial [Pontibacterium sp.]
NALPFTWDKQNPVDLQTEATPEMFANAVAILAKDKNVDGILVLHAPTFFAPGPQTADEVARVARTTQRNILTCFMGRATAIESRNRLAKGGVSTFITPEDCVEAFGLMAEYQRNQSVMRQTPMLYVEQNTPNHIRAKTLVTDALSTGRDFLYHSEVAQLLSLYEFPVVNSRYADTIDEVVLAAASLGGSVAVKALHKDNVYPFFYKKTFHQRWKDLVQDLYALTEVKHSVTKLAYRVGERYGADETMGYCVQTMKRGMQSMQMSLGITRDPVFGPLIIFGAGGAAVDVQADRQVMIPPLNSAQAKALVLRSRISEQLSENSIHFEEDLQTLADALIRLSEMIVDIPHISCLEIHPMLLNKRGVLVIDAAVSIGQPVETAISPYPEDLTEEVILRKSGRRATLRAIRGEDEPKHLAFFNSLSAESIRMRYFYSRGVPSHQELAMWTQIDYDREMAFIVTAPVISANGEDYETLGVVRAVTDADNVSSEFSVVIRDDLQGEGLGRMLMEKIIAYCKRRGTLQIEGSTLPKNKGMQGLAKKLGFTNRYNLEDEVVEMRLMLNEPTADWQKARLRNH